MKVLAAFVVGIVATLSTVLFIASSMAINADDIKDRKDAFIASFWTLVTIALCAFAFTLLTGCAELKYAECIARDNTSRPCQ